MPTKKVFQKKSFKIMLTGQIVIESDSFLEYWQNRLIHVNTASMGNLTLDIKINPLNLDISNQAIRAFPKFYL